MRAIPPPVHQRRRETAAQAAVPSATAVSRFVSRARWWCSRDCAQPWPGERAKCGRTRLDVTSHRAPGLLCGRQRCRHRPCGSNAAGDPVWRRAATGAGAAAGWPAPPVCGALHLRRLLHFLQPLAHVDQFAPQALDLAAQLARLLARSAAFGDLDDGLTHAAPGASVQLGACGALQRRDGPGVPQGGQPQRGLHANAEVAIDQARARAARGRDGPAGCLR